MNNKHTYNEKNTLQGKMNSKDRNQDKKKNKVHKGSERNKKNRRKYSDDEIARARYIDSKAVFLVRDHIKNENIDTTNKWIDITNLNVKDRWDDKGNYNPEIMSFDAELFDKTEVPLYEKHMTVDEKHILTYEVAKGDINKQKMKERHSQERKERPSYHLDVASVKTKEKRTVYKVKNIKKKGSVTKEG